MAANYNTTTTDAVVELHYPAFSFEKNFNEDAYLEWMKDNWTLTFWFSVVYVIMIVLGKYYMASRPRFEIRWALALWSGILALFSICGVVRMLPEAIAGMYRYGFSYAVCNPSHCYHPVTKFWFFLFVSSKAYELGDTAFIILRKQPLIFLHWYHHITVMIYSWYSYSDHTASSRIFILVNYFVHAIMYSYYTLRALRVSMPRVVMVSITLLQLIQMVIGLNVNMYVWRVKAQGGFCQQTYDNIKWSCTMYASYFVLFAHFFYRTYFTKKKKVE